MLSSEMFTQCDSWTSLIECWHFPLVKHSTPLSVTLVFERLRLWRNLQLWAMSWRDISVILMHPHKLRCSNREQLCVKAATASSVSLTHLRRYTVWRQQQDENTLLIPSEETSSLEFLVAFKSNFRRFLQTQMKESPLSETAHSHNSSSLSAGCNTLPRFVSVKSPRFDSKFTSFVLISTGSWAKEVSWSANWPATALRQ